MATSDPFAPITDVLVEIKERIAALDRKIQRTRDDANSYRHDAAQADGLADGMATLRAGYQAVLDGHTHVTVWECEPPAMGAQFHVVEDHWEYDTEPIVRHIREWSPAT